MSITPEVDIETDYIDFPLQGGLRLRKGMHGTVHRVLLFDTKNFMRGSLAHDALYQLMRIEHIERQWTAHADEELKKICLEDGMSRLRAGLQRLRREES